MTKEEAVSALRRYRREEVYTPSRKLLGWKTSTYEFNRAVYERFLVLELIREIKESNRNSPIDVVRDFYYKMDDILCESEQRRTWSFTSTMENCAHDMLIYLEREHLRLRRQRRKNEDGKH